MKSSDKSSAQRVNLDYFLYSCFEHEQASRSWPMNPDWRWPVVVDIQNQNPPPVLNEKSLEDLILDMLNWYADKYPTIDLKIDHETLGDIIPVFMNLTQDLDTLVKAKTSDYLPAFEQDQKEEVWEIVDRCFSSKLPQHASMFLRYLHWSHATQPPEINFDPGSRPPVGRFAPNFHSRPPQRDARPPRQERRPKPSSRPPREQNSKRGPRKGPPRGAHKQGGGEPRKPDKKLERESLKEVLLAVQTLNKNPDLEEYRLAPTNSFYRRLQHKQVKQEGLFSTSAGEGHDRSVVVLRSPPPGDSSGED